MTEDILAKLTPGCKLIVIDNNYDGGYLPQLNSVVTFESFLYNNPCRIKLKEIPNRGWKPERFKLFMANAIL